MASMQNGVEDGHGRFKSPETPSGLMIFMDIVNTATQIFIGATVSCAFVFASGQQGVISVHIYMCTIGYVLIMSQAILGLSPHTGWARSFGLQKRRLLHWVMQILGSVLAIIGSAIAMNGYFSSFRDGHSYIGFFAMVLTVLSLLGGLAHFLLNKQITKIIHIVSGAVAMILAFIALILGFNYFIGITTSIGIAFTVLALLGILLTAGVNTLKDNQH